MNRIRGSEEMQQEAAAATFKKRHRLQGEVQSHVRVVGGRKPKAKSQMVDQKQPFPSRLARAEAANVVMGAQATQQQEHDQG